MKRIPRRTLLLAALLALLLVTVVVSALTLPNDDDAEVRTREVLEMVASIDVSLLSVGFDPGAVHATSTPHGGTETVWLLVAVLAALGITRWRSSPRQHTSRSKRS